jgi:hypothetical protein
MKKYILGLVFALFVSFSFAEVTTLGGLALQDIYTIVTPNPALLSTGAASTSNIIGGNIPNKYTDIDLDSTTNTLNYSLVTVNAKNTTDNPVEGNYPTPRQFMIISCKAFTKPIAITVNSMIPAVVGNSLVFNAAGQTVLLQYNRADGYWHKIADSSASANSSFSVSTLTAVNGTISGTLTANALFVTTNLGVAVSVNTVSANSAIIGAVTVNTLYMTTQNGVNETLTGTQTATSITCNTLSVSGIATLNIANITNGGTITSNFVAPTTINIQNANYLATCPLLVTSAITGSNTTGNMNIPIIIKGQVVYIKANSAQ